MPRIEGGLSSEAVAVDPRNSQERLPFANVKALYSEDRIEQDTQMRNGCTKTKGAAQAPAARRSLPISPLRRVIQHAYRTLCALDVKAHTGSSFPALIM
eukprot:1493689-Amphidinium_carterae.2